MKSVIWSLLLFVGIRLQASSLLLSPDSIGSYPLSLAERYTTNLIFPAAIAQVDLGSGDVIAKKLGKMENVLLLKAGRVGFSPTNVSVYLVNGRLFSFRVSYADSLSVFNYSFRLDSALSAPPPSLPRAQLGGYPVPQDSLEADARMVARSRQFLKVKATSGKLRLVLQKIVLKDKLMWLGFRGDNKSPIDFRPEAMRFSVQDLKRIKRTAVQSSELKPVYSLAPEVVWGGSKKEWAVAFSPVTLAAGKRLIVEWTGVDGRRVRLVVRGRHILRIKNCDERSKGVFAEGERRSSYRADAC